MCRILSGERAVALFQMVWMVLGGARGDEGILRCTSRLYVWPVKGAGGSGYVWEVPLFELARLEANGMDERCLNY